jgi:hypothetical protein
MTTADPKLRRDPDNTVLSAEDGGDYNVISERLYNSNQSWMYQLIVNIEGHKLRVSIKRNAYDFQSYAKIMRWDGHKWHFITSMPIETCKCAAVSYVMRRDEHFDISLFRKDAKQLIEEAKEVVLES